MVIRETSEIVGTVEKSNSVTRQKLDNLLDFDFTLMCSLMEMYAKCTASIRVRNIPMCKNLESSLEREPSGPIFTQSVNPVPKMNECLAIRHR
jgi:hypothetical protein